VQAIVIAAGMSKRLWPLSNAISKPMFQLFDKPVIGHIIKGIKKAGFKEVLVVCRKDDKILQNYVKSLKCKVFYQEKPEGTAKAVEVVKDHVKDEFLIAPGDHFLDVNIYSEISKYKDPVVVAKYIKGDEIKNFGVLDVECGIIKNIIEKPEDIKEGFANLLIVKTNKEIFKGMKNLKKSKRNEYELVELLNGHVMHLTNREWLDLGWPWTFLKALSIHLKDKVFIDKTAVVENSRLIGPCYIGKGCVIRNSVLNNAHVCDHCVIENSEVENSYVMQNAIIKSSSLKNSFLGIKTHLERVKTKAAIKELSIPGKAFLPPIDIGVITAPHVNARNKIFSCEIVCNLL
jgi:glucose-1-phosphate thymidylyltransferase